MVLEARAARGVRHLPLRVLAVAVLAGILARVARATVVPVTAAVLRPVLAAAAAARLVIPLPMAAVAEEVSAYSVRAQQALVVFI
jgi:hypothetical protein